MKKRIFLCGVILVVMIFAFVAGGCGGQEPPKVETEETLSQYPQDNKRAIEFVVHSSPGSGTDIFARTISRIFVDHKIVENPVIVNNRGGGGGAVARSYVGQENRGNPYVMLTTQPTAISRPLQNEGDMHYTDFTSIANLVSEPIVVVVRQASQFNEMKDLVQAAGERRVTMGGGTVGSGEHMCGFLIQEAAGVEFPYISFTTGGESVTAILGGHVDFILANPSQVISHVESGSLRLLGIASVNRLPSLPEVPTLKEQGLDVEWYSFRGIVMPQDITPDVVDFWVEAITKVVETPDFVEYVENNMLEVIFQTGSDFDDFLQNEEAKVRRILEAMELIK